MTRKTAKKQPAATVTKIKGNHAVTELGSEVLVPTLAQLRKVYGSLVDGMECPKTRLSHARAALKYGCRVTVDKDGLIAIFGWDWHAKLPIQLSAVKGLDKSVQRQAIAMMNDSGFMTKNEPQSSKGLLEAEAKKLYTQQQH
jgi:hypothetical protein